MAEHDDAAARRLNEESAQRFSGPYMAIAVSVAAFVVLAGLAGWLGFRTVQHRQVQAQQEQFIEAARQGALNLTSIDHSTVEADIQRILDTSTGVFHDDFEKRSQPFAEVVRKAESTSEGSVTSAGLESRDGDTAQVLVVMSVKMSNPGAAEPEPQTWRMRIGVQREGDVAKMSDVAYVS